MLNLGSEKFMRRLSDFLQIRQSVFCSVVLWHDLNTPVLWVSGSDVTFTTVTCICLHWPHICLPHWKVGLCSHHTESHIWPRNSTPSCTQRHKLIVTQHSDLKPGTKKAFSSNEFSEDQAVALFSGSALHLFIAVVYFLATFNIFTICLLFVRPSQCSFGNS